MKAPDKIYLHGYDFNENPYRVWSECPVKGMRGYEAINVDYIRKDALLKYFYQRIEELNSPLNGVFGSTERDNCNERISELLLLVDKLNEMEEG